MLRLPKAFRVVGPVSRPTEEHPIRKETQIIGRGLYIVKSRKISIGYAYCLSPGSSTSLAWGMSCAQGAPEGYMDGFQLAIVGG